MSRILDLKFQVSDLRGEPIYAQAGTLRSEKYLGTAGSELWVVYFERIKGEGSTELRAIHDFLRKASGQPSVSAELEVQRERIAILAETWADQDPPHATKLRTLASTIRSLKL